MTRGQIAREKGKIAVSKEDPGLKGCLNDILQAIDIEESPLVQEDFINLDEGKSKKIKSSKKLDFNDEISEFVFKPKRPLTTNSKKFQGLDVELDKLDVKKTFLHEYLDENICME